MRSINSLHIRNIGFNSRNKLHGNLLTNRNDISRKNQRQQEY